MATGGGILRILILSTLIASSAAVALHLTFSRNHLPAIPPSCNPIPPNMTLIGASLTVTQVEAASLAEMLTAPAHIPRVPFGNSNTEWISLKRHLEPGDRLYRFRTAVTGGYVAIRRRCVVGQLTEWIR